MKIDTLEPDFRAKVAQLLANTEAATGLKWVITSGRRTMAEQQALFDQGRTTPGKVVTNAKPGSSAHNFGLAADLAPLQPGKRVIWWDAPRSKWRMMADEAVKLGLTAGFYFKTIFDAPHVEAKDWRAVRAEWLAGRVQVA